MRVMNKAINNGRGNNRLRKKPTPVIKVKITGQNDGALFITSGDELKKKIGFII